MPTSLFLELNPEKQQKIFTAGISEFAEYGYESSSTNRIVKKAGISKGSLFKYFPKKEDFYFYILDQITSELISSLEGKEKTLSTDLFQRIVDYSVLEFSWYTMYPEKAKMIVKAFTNSDTHIYRKTMLKYGNKQQEIFHWFLQDIDTAQFPWGREKTTDLLKWFLKGFNEDFSVQLQVLQDTDFEKLKKEYVNRLSEYLELLKKGIAK